MMDHFTEAAYPTNLYIYLTRGDTFDINKKEIGCRRVPSGVLSNTHFQPSFYCSSGFLDSSESSACRSNAPILSLEQFLLMYNLQDTLLPAFVGPDIMSFFSRYSNIFYLAPIVYA